LDYAKFSVIAAEVGAVAMADMAHLAGLIAGGILANPFDHGFQVMTSTTHKTLRGPRGGLILSQGTVSSSQQAPERAIANLPTLIDRAVFPGLQGGPHMNVILAKAVAFEEASQPQFKDYAQKVLLNAQSLATALLERGVKLITGGTDNHLMVIDAMASWEISGGQAQDILDQIGLTVNKNVIPDDLRSASDPSGIRLGTPAITTRGLVESDMPQLADWIVQAIAAADDEAKLKVLRAEVQTQAAKHPLP
jgi:glycine hydroxymethyltransferase